MYAKRIAVAAILAVIIFGAVYGFATTITIEGVQGVGSGSANVPQSPNVNRVVFLIDSNDYAKVDQVVIYLTSTMNGHAYVQITDSNTNVIASGSNWVSDNEVTVDFTPNVLASDVYDIRITLLEE